MYHDFVSTLDDNCLTQMVQEPTRESNILDLFFNKQPDISGFCLCRPRYFGSFSSDFSR